MQDSNAVVKKIYCIVINGKIQEDLSFKSLETTKEYNYYSRNIQNKYRYHYKGDLPECGLKIK